MEFSEEQLEKVSNAKSAEEIIAIAKAENIDLTKEQAENYFRGMHIEKTGKVSDDELDNVVGGTCYSKGKGVVNPINGKQRRYAIVSPLNFCPLPKNKGVMCMDCGNSFRIGATWYCGHRWWADGGGHEVTG